MSPRSRRPGVDGGDPAAASRVIPIRSSSRIRPSSCPKARSCSAPARRADRRGRIARAGPANAISPMSPRLDEGFVDGGDILILPDEILIGLSARTDQAGRRALLRAGPRPRPHAPGSSSRRPACSTSRPAAPWSTSARLIAVPALAPLFPGYEVLVTPRGRGARGQSDPGQRPDPDGRRLSADGRRCSPDRGLDVVETPAVGDREDRRRPLLHVAALAFGRGVRPPSPQRRLGPHG